MKTEILSFKMYDKIKKIIEDDGVVAFPTETVYGLGARYDSFLAYKKIFKAKNRDMSKVLTLMLSDVNEIKKYAKVDLKTQKVIDSFLPGALTLILDIKEDLELIGIDKTVGIRVPDSKETLKLLNHIKIPMFVTSANISNEQAATSFEEVYDQLAGKIEGIVKGEIKHKQASTIIKINNGELELLREGPITLDEVKEVYYL